MPATITLYNTDGTVNLDLSSKILRWKYMENRRYASGDVQTFYNPMTGSNIGITSKNTWGDGAPILVNSTGTAPSKPFILRSCMTDGAVYVCSPGGIYNQGGCSSTSALIKAYFGTESWSDSGGLGTDDPIRIYSQTGDLLWSAGTLKNALVFVKRLEFTALNQVKSYTSTRNRRLFIAESSVFSSGTWDGEGPASSSGIIASWSNAGKTINAACYSKSDGDIVQGLSKRGSLSLDIYEVLGD